jgi:hypothetical protein
VPLPLHTVEAAGVAVPATEGGLTVKLHAGAKHEQAELKTYHVLVPADSAAVAGETFPEVVAHLVAPRYH